MNKDALNQWLEVKIANEGISLRELARRAGVNQSAISKMLNGKGNATLDFYVTVAETFGGAMAHNPDFESEPGGQATPPNTEPY